MSTCLCALFHKYTLSQVHTHILTHTQMHHITMTTTSVLNWGATPVNCFLDFSQCVRVSVTPDSHTCQMHITLYTLHHNNSALKKKKKDTVCMLPEKHLGTEITQTGQRVTENSCLALKTKPQLHLNPYPVTCPWVKASKPKQLQGCAAVVQLILKPGCLVGNFSATKSDLYRRRIFCISFTTSLALHNRRKNFNQLISDTYYVTTVNIHNNVITTLSWLIITGLLNSIKWQNTKHLPFPASLNVKSCSFSLLHIVVNG